MSHVSWSVHSLYQPVVDLETLDVVGYEALARGVPGSAAESADALFSQARARDDVVGLEWACRGAAMSGALDVGLAPGTTLFVNAEPVTFGLTAPSALWALADELGTRGIPVVVEVTERELARDPRALLCLRQLLNDHGWMLAIDDVGADPASLAMLPLLDPDVIKLDMSLVQQQPDERVARIMNAVNAQASLTGARVIAEGVETPQQREYASSFGATLAQGWLFGRPAPLPRATTTPCPSVAVTSLPGRRTPPRREPDTPWEAVESSATVRTSTAPMLTAMSRHLESQALAGDDATVVLAALQDTTSLLGRTRLTYEAIARVAFFVGVLGRGVEPAPLPGVRGVDLAADDPLARDWDVVVVTPHFAAALVAVEVDASPAREGDDRVFRYVLTYHRPLVLQVARIVLSRFDRADKPSVRPAVTPAHDAAVRLAAPHRADVASAAPARGSGGLEVLVRAAARRDDVVVHYQPVVGTAAGARLHAVEALLRLDDGLGDALPARMFLGFAERLGLMPTFTARLIEQACAQMRDWLLDLGAFAPPVLYVNVGHGDLVDVDAICEVVRRHGLPARSVGFEFVPDPANGPSVPGALQRLRRCGHPLALDRHGRSGSVVPSAHGSVPDTVKIDRSLVATMTQDRGRTVRRLVDTAHALGATATAVGVETQEQRAMLRRLRCDFVQGYAIAAPQGADELGALLARWRGADVADRSD